jgi:endo-1,4-beta-D-glucanase Y
MAHKRRMPLVRHLIRFFRCGLLWVGVFLTAACGGEDPARLPGVLKTSWASYCRRQITPEGRVVLKERQGGSISEAQAYALLRAVWAGDEDSFGRVYRWTREHLSREKTHGDHLLAWLWGPRPDGSWGVLDANTASDANLDYALALVLAARRGWLAPPGLPPYLDEARRVAADIMAHEVVELPSGALLLAPGNWRERTPPYLINPSYFSPAAYRLFAQQGFNPRWQRLHAEAYPALERLSRKLGETPGVGLIPDWAVVAGDGTFAPHPQKDTHFGWEAVRLPWRLALDRLWFGDLNAARLSRSQFLPFFQREWRQRGTLVAVYGYDGSPQVDFDSPVLYAGALAAALAAGDQEFAWQMAKKILAFYHQEGDNAYFVNPDNYYADNWAWFGLALYAKWVKLF